MYKSSDTVKGGYQFGGSFDSNDEVFWFQDTIKYFTSQYFERWKAPSSCHQTDSPERKSAARLAAFYIGEERSLCCAKIN